MTRNTRVYGYVRISSKEQRSDRQHSAIDEYAKENGIALHEVIEDKVSGKNFDRHGYSTLKKLLRTGDTLIIKELDRFGRNMSEIKQEWQELTRSGVNIIIIDTPILNTRDKSDMEKTLISNIVFELLAYMAEKERLKIKLRQAEGIISAKGKGKHLGRPKAEYPLNWAGVYTDWKSGQFTAKHAMELLGLKRTTFYKLVKQYEEA